MFRCVSLAALGLLVAASVQAQVTRQFPATALRGEVLVTQPPEILVNGKPALLAPGARIRRQDNMLVMSGAIVGQKLIAHYTIDSLGSVHDVWVLSADEMAKRPWPTTPQQAQQWSFDWSAQAWTKP